MNAPLVYPQLRLVRTFVALAKAGGRGLTYAELEQTLGYAPGSAAVRVSVRCLAAWKLLYGVRMAAEPRQPWRLWATRPAWVQGGAQTFVEWDGKWKGINDG